MDHWSDYVIFALFLVISLGIGFFHACTGGKQSTLNEFILNNRKLKLIPTAISMAVSYISAIAVIGGAAEIYIGGLIAFPMSIAAELLGCVIIERLIVPWIYPLQLTSINKYFELRYGNNYIRVFSACLGVITMLAYMGTATFACSLALEIATGFPAYASMSILPFVSAIYTCLGGIRAVIWTDVFQFIVLFGGMLAVLIKAAMAVSLPEAFNVLVKENRQNIATTTGSIFVRHTVWAFIIGNTTHWIGLQAFSQVSVQRYSGLKSLADARRLQYLGSLVRAPLMCISFLTGTLIFAYYAIQECDPILSGKINKSNQIFSLFVRNMFSDNTGFSGLFLAALYSGGLSSISSSMSSAATVLWVDVLSIKLSNLSPARATLINKVLVLFFAGITVALAFMADSFPGPILQVTILLNSIDKGPLLCLFLMAGLKIFKWANPKGVLSGAVVGLIFSTWIFLGSRTVPKTALPPLSVEKCVPGVNYTAPAEVQISGFLPKMYSISYLWYGLFGTIVSVVAGTLISAVMYFACSREHLEREVPDYLFVNFRDAISWHKEPIKKETNDKRATKYEKVAMESTDGKNIMS